MVRILFAIIQAFRNCQMAQLICKLGIHIGLLIGFDIKAVVLATTHGCFLYAHCRICHGENAGFQGVVGTQFFLLVVSL